KVRDGLVVNIWNNTWLPGPGDVTEACSEYSLSSLLWDYVFTKQVLQEALWYNRNKVLHEGIRKWVQDTVVFINGYYLKIEQLGELSGVMQRPKFDSWELSESDVIKINFDAFYHQKLHKSSSGIIARNKEGLVMATCIYPWENVLNPILAKVRACLQVVIFTKELGFRDVCVEENTLTVVKKLKSTEEDRSNISNLIKDIKGRVPKFRSIQFRFVPRMANETTHGLAMESSKYDYLVYWMEEASMEATDSLMNSVAYGEAGEQSDDIWKSRMVWVHLWFTNAMKGYGSFLKMK
ncbi:hypothetical protein Goklo_006541, partial [Gossypium klotzschianum]|nr:hypothetical protein [Gossypium klotzschianum]